MSKKKWDPPTQDDVNRLIAGLREIEKDIRGASREATEFKPGELTPEEEEFVKREGLKCAQLRSPENTQEALRSIREL